MKTKTTKKWWRKRVKRSIFLLIIVGILAYISYYLRVFNPHDFGEVDYGVLQQPEKPEISKEHNLVYTIQPILEKIGEHIEKLKDEEKKAQQKVFIKNINTLITPKMYHYLQNNPELVQKLETTIKNNVWYTDTTLILPDVLSEIPNSNSFFRSILPLVWKYACSLGDFSSCARYINIPLMLWNQREQDTIIVWYLIAQTNKNASLDAMLEVLSWENQIPIYYTTAWKTILDKQKIDYYQKNITNTIINEYHTIKNLTENTLDSSESCLVIWCSYEWIYARFLSSLFFLKEDTHYLLDLAFSEILKHWKTTLLDTLDREKNRTLYLTRKNYLGMQFISGIFPNISQIKLQEIQEKLLNKKEQVLKLLTPQSLDK